MRELEFTEKSASADRKTKVEVLGDIIGVPYRFTHMLPNAGGGVLGLY